MQHHAQAGVLPTRINYTAPASGLKGALLISPRHFAYILPKGSVAPGTTAASLSEFPTGRLVQAARVNAGDLIAVATGDDASTFEVAVVTDSAGTSADGYYLPATESSYLIAENIVAPM